MENDFDQFDEEEQVFDLSNSDVVTKYRTAADIANRALQAVIAACKPGKTVAELCTLGDRIIEEGVAGVYNKGAQGKVDKGIAFPTCVSVNELAGHVSPFPHESATLQEGDVCKIDLGCHIDGFIGAVAHTVVATESSEKITGRKADVILAAYNAAEAAVRLLAPGNKNNQVTETIQKISDSFQVQPIEGVLSHQMKKHIIDGNKVIINKQNVEQKVEETEFEVNEVYCIDVLVSTGEGKTKETELRTMVFKRAVENNYNLKMKASRQFFSQVNEKFPTLPFTIRAISDEKVGRMGVVECLKHDLLYSYPVLSEKAGEVIAQFKFTVLLLAGGTAKITGVPLTQQFETTNSITDPALVQLLQTSLNKKKQKKNRKKKAASGGNDSGDEEEKKE
eukprot:GILI01001011.1.p1 GENE.GILI01001011.1~~GILI01001011.1.p1  ORF type:complete len:393 (+),score=166.27 GILI01001011.1:48-1226(+)